MKNAQVGADLQRCRVELERIQSLESLVGADSEISAFLSRYAIIRACGTVECAVKDLIVELCGRRCKTQVKTYLRNQIRARSLNPKYQAICNLLGQFDEDWKRRFKARIDSIPRKDQVIVSLDTLVDCRNEFAHGGTPRATISDTLAHFQSSEMVLVELETAIT